MRIDYNQAIGVFKKGIENQGYIYNVVNTKRSLFFEIKKSCLLILYILLSKKGQVQPSKAIKIVNGNHQFKVLAELEYQKILIGASLIKISGETLNNSMFSSLGLSERLRVLFKSLRFFLRGNTHATLSESIEFVGLSMLFETLAPKIVLVAGHFDRYTTWIAYLAEIYGFELAIMQHGCVGTESLPHKVPCSELFGFNEEEILCFEDFIIKKRAAYKAHIKKANTTVKFTNFDNLNHDTLIAFATGWNLIDNSIDLVKRIRALNFSGKIFFYIHPSADVENFAKLKEYDVILCPIERHRNIDVLITHASSLVYDYQSIGFKGEIICFKDEQTQDRVPAMFNNPNIHVYDSIDKILAHVV